MPKYLVSMKIKFFCKNKVNNVAYAHKTKNHQGAKLPIYNALILRLKLITKLEMPISWNTDNDVQ